MIAQITGTIAHRGGRFVVVTANNIGYRVFLSAESLRALPHDDKTAIKLWTHLAVRENALDLYGFITKIEHDWFELLISVSGIGPKSAISILSIAPPAVLQKAIVAGDAAYLTKVSGLGKKSAEKIVLELKDKLGGMSDDAPAPGQDLSDETEAIEALQALGYNLREAREALHGLPASLDTGEKVKSALKMLAK